jgi:hypothetical protein
MEEVMSQMGRLFLAMQEKAEELLCEFSVAEARQKWIAIYGEHDVDVFDERHKAIEDAAVEPPIGVTEEEVDAICRSRE